MLRRISFLTVFACVLLMSSSSLMAQRGAGAGGGGAGAGGAGGAGGGRGRGGGGGGPAAQLDLIKVQLGATDEEWRVLSPKVEKLLAAWTDVYQTGERGVNRGGGAGGGGGRGGRGGAGGAAGGRGGPGGNANSEVARALAELQTTLDNTASTPEQISAKLGQYREAKAKAVANLALLRKDLKDLLTSRQEALMVSYGYLD